MVIHYQDYVYYLLEFEVALLLDLGVCDACLRTFFLSYIEVGSFFI